MPRGALIALDGGSRCGKSTHAKLLSENLETEGIPNVVVRIPDPETDTGKIIQQWIASGKNLHECFALRLLFAANCWETAATLYEHLKNGKTVIVDDFASYRVAFYMGIKGDCGSTGSTRIPNPDLSIALRKDTFEFSDTEPRVPTSLRSYNKTYFRQHTSYALHILRKRMPSGFCIWRSRQSPALAASFASTTTERTAVIMVNTTNAFTKIKNLYLSFKKKEKKNNHGWRSVPRCHGGPEGPADRCRVWGGDGRLCVRQVS